MTDTPKTGGTKQSALGRRDMLKVLGLGAGASMASVAPVAAQSSGESNADRTKARYRDSAEVKRFYETARYPK